MAVEMERQSPEAWLMRQTSAAAPAHWIQWIGADATAAITHEYGVFPCSDQMLGLWAIFLFALAYYFPFIKKQDCLDYTGFQTKTQLGMQAHTTESTCAWNQRYRRCSQPSLT